jgi:hypothetical protein
MGVDPPPSSPPPPSPHPHRMATLRPPGTKSGAIAALVALTCASGSYQSIANTIALLGGFAADGIIPVRRTIDRLARNNERPMPLVLSPFAQPLASWVFDGTALLDPSEPVIVGCVANTFCSHLNQFSSAFRLCRPPASSLTCRLTRHTHPQTPIEFTRAHVCQIAYTCTQAPTITHACSPARSRTGQRLACFCTGAVRFTFGTRIL